MMDYFDNGQFENIEDLVRMERVICEYGTFTYHTSVDTPSIWINLGETCQSQVNSRSEEFVCSDQMRNIFLRFPLRKSWQNFPYLSASAKQTDILAMLEGLKFCKWNCKIS